MLPNIKMHSIQVMRVAEVIVNNLKEGVAINKDLVIAASLLHDITKTKALETHERHDVSGAELLGYLGFHEIAEIVRQHVILENFDPDKKLDEREIVYYADKRVMHDIIVSIEDRVQDLIIRYGKTPEIRNQILKNRGLVLKVEKKISNNMKTDINTAINNLRPSV